MCETHACPCFLLSFLSSSSSSFSPSASPSSFSSSRYSHLLFLPFLHGWPPANTKHSLVCVLFISQLISPGLAPPRAIYQYVACDWQLSGQHESSNHGKEGRTWTESRLGLGLTCSRDRAVWGQLQPLRASFVPRAQHQLMISVFLHTGTPSRFSTMPTLPSAEHTAFLPLCNKPDLGSPQESLFLSAIMSLGVKMPSTWVALSPALCSNLASVLL